ncbi:hypothetical protein BDK51DRAFT_30726 [Blyttiomyces helicus]|uniref:Uncharacterized protein n=1 Tax=Blyttiomyces helicus TaxID=388810 RepID=A0A4P9WLN2_9FUNG|nr:hypothetical protein BDK51DRAFT_30726 [Blyttiomyces helicus]|eukprot:RKO91566.1 hypothetical protein BDK51DRAFT_30726 [Blyttiomyces helicus]
MENSSFGSLSPPHQGGQGGQKRGGKWRRKRGGKEKGPIWTGSRRTGLEKTETTEKSGTKGEGRKDRRTGGQEGEHRQPGGQPHTVVTFAIVSKCCLNEIKVKGHSLTFKHFILQSSSGGETKSGQRGGRGQRGNSLNLRVCSLSHLLLSYTTTDTLNSGNDLSLPHPKTCGIHQLPWGSRQRQDKVEGEARKVGMGKSPNKEAG